MRVSKAPAPKVLLSSRGYIDCMDAGLSSVEGAQGVISMVSSRKFVTKLILGHNDLSDDGSIVLFKFLSSSLGRKYQIAEISLNGNGIGNRGLSAITEYLRGNLVLKELFLQNNLFTGEGDTIAAFARALNTSRLDLLSLTTNPTLSDSFVEVFLPLLDSPNLRELHLSATGLTPKSAPHLIDYLSSSRCRLHILKCNGNSLGFRAVKAIVRAMERHNFSLLSIELHANMMGPTSSDNTSDDDEDGPPNPDAWKAIETRIRRVLLRNSHLKRETEKEALLLLRCVRPLLLPRTSTPAVSGSQHSADLEPAPTTEATSRSLSNQTFPFLSLPTELQLYIASFLAPTLSPTQRIRIYTYASSPSTLPRVGLFLPGARVCVLDPASMPFGNSAASGCAGGKCAGSVNSVLCHREQQRSEWLAAVGCSAYDPHRGDESEDDAPAL